MALVTFAEAAIKMGWSVELIESFTTRCPKAGDDRVLVAEDVRGIPHLHESDLEDFRRYLAEPWPRTRAGSRPHILKAIADDVRAESHQGCGICGAMDNGELAHIDPAADTLNNSPDNLLFLCPNHHTKYDFGHRPASNVDRETVLAAKKIKRASRRRMLRYEGNTARALRVLITTIKNIEAQAAGEQDEMRRQTYVTELQALVEAIPALGHEAEDAASKDQGFAEDEAALVKIAPTLVRLTQGAAVAAAENRASEAATRTAAQSVIEASQPVIELDEADCPHCGGRGTQGLLGDLCDYCKGSQVVSRAQAEEYDPDQIDEVPCPHSEGAGTTGLMSDICTYCSGRQMVSDAQAEEYDPDQIDEVPCPHCEGAGTTGLMSDICTYCKGSQVVSEAKAEEYDVDAIDEVECPRCDGMGTVGLVGDVCRLCKGRTVVATSVARAFESGRA